MTQPDLFPRPTPPPAQLKGQDSFQPLTHCPRCGEPSEKVRPYWWSVREGTRCDPCFDREIDEQEKGLRP